jgi:outer membrane receptor protein involved in Fe transport
MIRFPGRFFQPAGSGFGQFITENAGKAEIKGLELEVIGLLTNSLEVGGNFAWLDAEYTEFTGTPAATGESDFSGNRLRQFPEYSVYLYTMYTFRLENSGNISAKVDAVLHSGALAHQDTMALPLPTISPGNSICHTENRPHSILDGGRFCFW